MGESNEKRNNFTYPLIVGLICAIVGAAVGGWFSYATQDKKEDSLVKSMASRFDGIEENMELEHALDNIYKEYTELKAKEEATSNANSSLENELGKKLDATVSNPALVVEGLKKQSSIGKGIAEVDGDIFYSSKMCSEIYGKEPTYNKDENTVYFSKEDKNLKENKSKLLDSVAYEYTVGIVESSDDKIICIGGVNYNEGINLKGNNCYMTIYLKGGYSKLDFDVGRIFGTVEYNATLKVFLDGEYSGAYTLDSEKMISHMSIDLNKAEVLKLVYDSDNYDAEYGLVNCTLTK